jgi:N-acetylglutamate synthase-like GNAT family acetyltransferase
MTIVPFCDELAPAFAALNYAWLERSIGVQDIDRSQLENPRETILATGGEVFFAIDGEHVVGTVAGIRRADAMELAKLCVADDAQRNGTGRRLVQSMLEFAREAGAGKVTVTASSQLIPVLRLCQAMGFRAVGSTPLTANGTADVLMELVLPQAGAAPAVGKS